MLCLAETLVVHWHSLEVRMLFIQMRVLWLARLQINSQELQANIVAAYVCNGQSSDVPQLAIELRLSGNSSEVTFNLACALLQQGAFQQAEQQLQLALRAGATPHV